MNTLNTAAISAFHLNSNIFLNFNFNFKLYLFYNNNTQLQIGHEVILLGGE